MPLLPRTNKDALPRVINKHDETALMATAVAVNVDSVTPLLHTTVNADALAEIQSVPGATAQAIAMLERKENA